MPLNPLVCRSGSSPQLGPRGRASRRLYIARRHASVLSSSTSKLCRWITSRARHFRPSRSRRRRARVSLRAPAIRIDPSAWRSKQREPGVPSSRSIETRFVPGRSQARLLPHGPRTAAVQKKNRGLTPRVNGHSPDRRVRVSPVHRVTGATSIRRGSTGYKCSPRNVMI